MSSLVGITNYLTAQLPVVFAGVNHTPLDGAEVREISEKPTNSITGPLR